MKIVETINDALYELGVVDVTEEPAPEDSAFALRTLNRIMDGLNTRGLLIPFLHQLEYSDKTEWISSDIEITNHIGDEISPYRIEADGIAYDRITATPPNDIQQLFFRDSTNSPVDYACSPMTSREYAERPYKGVVGIPTKYFVSQNTPDSTVISFNAIPQQGLKLNIFGKLPYKTNFDPQDDVLWGTGVEKMVMLRLAVEVAGSYHIEITQLLAARAMEAENQVSAYNYQPRTISSDIGLLKNRGRSRYNPARI